MVQDVAASRSGQVEIAVVGQVDQRRPIGHGRVINRQFIFLVQRIDDRNIKHTRIALVAVGTAMGEADGGKLSSAGDSPIFVGANIGTVPGERLGLPNDAVEPPRAAVQVLLPVVERQTVLRPIELELTADDPKRDAADDAAEIRASRLVRFEIVEAEHDVRNLPVPVGCPKLGHRGPKSDDPPFTPRLLLNV